MTAKRPRRRVENDEYAAFVRRILRAYSRRVGDGDVGVRANATDAGEPDQALQARIVHLVEP